MMRLTYIFHSGFALETEHAVMVFDYWLQREPIVQRILAIQKPLYVLVSHFHEDHFNAGIFQWRERRGDVTYILSKDILRHRRASREQADVWMAKGSVYEDERLKVTATGSNDSGVSWVVEIEGKFIFHAGDLNNWYARFLTDTPGVLVHEEELAPGEDPVRGEKMFLGELKEIRRITDHFDLVMFPVDGRIGNGYTKGGRQFISMFRVGMFVPMHFVASGFRSAARFSEFTAPAGIPFWSISRDGEQIEIQ